jgi:hypothetical protein
MSTLTPEQEQMRRRVEGLIRVVTPALDLVLAAGERLSRVVEPEDYDYYPARPLGERPARRHERPHVERPEAGRPPA